MRQIHRLILVAGIALAAAPPTLAQDRSADITFSGGSLAAGVGCVWGDGTLHFRGRNCRFSIGGLNVVDIGVARIDGMGDVYNLQRIEDFPGTYVAAAAGASVAGGGDLAVLRNQNGVQIYVHSTTQGLKVDLSANGVAVALK